MMKLKTAYLVSALVIIFDACRAQLINAGPGRVTPAAVSTGALPQSRGSFWQFASGGPNTPSTSFQCQHWNFGAQRFDMATNGFALTMTFAFLDGSPQSGETLFALDTGRAEERFVLQRNGNSTNLVLRVGTSSFVATGVSLQQNTIYNLAVVYSKASTGSNFSLRFSIANSAHSFFFGQGFTSLQTVNTYVGRSDAQLNANCFSGAIFSLNLFNRALSTTEVQQMAMNLTQLSLDPVTSKDDPFVSVVPGAVSPAYTSAAQYPFFGRRFLRFDSPGLLSNNPMCRHLNFGAQQMLLQSQGFTLTATLRFIRSLSSFERIIDFGSGSSINAFVLARAGATSNFTIRAQTGATSSPRVTLSSFAIVQDAIINVAYVLSPNESVVAFYIDGNLVESPAILLSVSDVTVSAAYVGLSWWASAGADGCVNADMFSVKTFNRMLNATEIRNAVVQPLAMPIISIGLGQSATPFIVNTNAGLAQTTRGFRFSGGNIANNCAFLNFGSEMFNFKTSGFSATMVMELPLQTTSTAVEAIFEFNDATSGNALYLYRHKATNMLMFGFQNMESAGSDFLNYTLPQQQSDVYRIGVVYSVPAAWGSNGGVNGALSIWINGTQVATKNSAALTYARFSNMQFGSSLNANASTDCFTGFLSMFKVYERAISSAELSADLNQNFTICPAASFMNDTTGQCQPCAARTMKPNAGNSIGYCQPCPINTYSQIGANNCTACPANSICLSAGSGMFQCAAGFTLNSDGTGCQPCPSGAYKTTTGNAVCLNCPLNASCANATSLFQCNAGFTLNSGSTGCSACAPGSSKASLGNAACTLCQPGSFQSQNAQITCVDCPPNAGCLQSGMSSFNCSQGYRLSADQQSCVLVPPPRPTTTTTTTTTTTASTTMTTMTSAMPSSTPTVSVFVQPRINLNVTLFKGSPDKTFIDPVNDVVSIALTLPPTTALANFSVTFTLSTDSGPLLVNLNSISTISTTAPSVPRYFFKASQLGTQIIRGGLLTIIATVTALNPSRFTRPSTDASLTLQFSAPPAGGQCRTSSTAPGVAWETNFNISCTGWSSNMPGDILYAISAVPVKTADQLAQLQQDPTTIPTGLVQWPIISNVLAGIDSQVTLPTGLKEGNYSVALLAEMSMAIGSRTRAFVASVTVWPFQMSANPITSQNLSQVAVQLADTLKNATADKTLQIAQRWSAALTEVTDTAQKQDICNNMLQSVANAFTVQPSNGVIGNVSAPVDVAKLQQAASTVGALLTQNSVQLTTDTQSAAVNMLTNVAQVYLQQSAPVQMDQVQMLAQSFDAIMKSNLAGRADDGSNSPSSPNSPPSAGSPPSASPPSNEANEQNRQITAQFVQGVQAITAVVAASLAVNQPPVVIQTDSFQAIAQKTDIGSLSAVNNGDTPVVSNLDSAIGAYDFSASNPAFANKPKESQVVLTKFTSFANNPFAGLSSDSSQNAKQRSSVSSFSLSDSSGNALHINNTPSCINLNFQGNLTFSYTITNTSLNVSTIVLKPGAVILSTTRNALNHTAIVIGPKCQYWDTALSKWSTDGCSYVVNPNDLTQSTCCCRHLTDFSAEIGSPDDILSIQPVLPPLDRVITITDLSNVVSVIQVLSVVVGLYLMGVAILLLSRQLGSRNRTKIREAKLHAMPLPENKLQRFKHVYLLILRIDHMWFSVLHDHSAISSFTQIQRWTVCVTALLTNLTVVTAFYASTLRANANSNLITDFVTGIYVSLITYPFMMALKYLFDRPAMESQQAGESQSKARMLARAGLVICLLFLGVDVYFLLAYAVSFPQDAIAPWLTSFVGTIVNEVLLTGPMKVTALTLLTVSGVSPRYEKELRERREKAQRYLDAHQFDDKLIETGRSGGSSSVSTMATATDISWQSRTSMPSATMLKASQMQARPRPISICSRHHPGNVPAASAGMSPKSPRPLSHAQVRRMTGDRTANNEVSAVSLAMSANTQSTSNSARSSVASNVGDAGCRMSTNRYNFMQSLQSVTPTSSSKAPSPPEPGSQLPGIDEQ